MQSSNQWPQIFGIRIFKTKNLDMIQHFKTTGCSPSSSDMTIKESVISRERDSDLGTGLIT